MLAALHWIVAALATSDAADTEHQRDRLAMVVRTPGAMQIFLQVEELRSIASLCFYLAVDLIPISNRVRQFRCDGFFAQIRSRVHDRLEFLRCNLSRLADAVLHLVEP